MEIILIDDVFELGKRGKVLRVADGYGRNYLIPKNLAIPATPGNRKMIEQQRLAMAKKETKYQEEAELLTQELNQLHLMLSRKSGETGTLFGSVTSKDIADLLKTAGIQLDRRKIVLNQPIKSIGNYRIEVRPHSEVTAKLLLSILVEGDEPVSKIKKKDEESDAIVAELEARLKEMKQSMATESSRWQQRASFLQNRKTCRLKKKPRTSNEKKSRKKKRRQQQRQQKKTCNNCHQKKLRRKKLKGKKKKGKKKKKRSKVELIKTPFSTVRDSRQPNHSQQTPAGQPTALIVLVNPPL